MTNSTKPQRGSRGREAFLRDMLEHLEAVEAAIRARPTIGGVTLAQVEVKRKDFQSELDSCS